MRVWQLRVLVPFSFFGLIVYLCVFGTSFGLDLSVYRDAVIFWQSGGDPYAARFTRSGLPFTYPPFALVALSPFAWLRLSLDQWVLWAASIGLATGAVILIVRSRGLRSDRGTRLLALGWVCASALVMEPVRSAMDYGQIELVVMSLVIADFLFVPRRYRGILLGMVAAVKLTPLIFFINLVAARDVKSTGRALASFAGCGLIMWVLWPSQSREFWFHDPSQPGRDGSVTYPGNQCWYAVVSRMHLTGYLTEIAWILLSLATLAVGSFIAWRCVRLRRNATALVATALTGLLISPISWSHHWVWVILIPPLVLAGREPGVGVAVDRLLIGIVIVTCVAPYWLFQSAGIGSALQALLPVYTAGVLVTWAAIERAALRAGQFEPDTAPVPSAGRLPGLRPSGSSGRSFWRDLGRLLRDTRRMSAQWAWPTPRLERMAVSVGSDRAQDSPEAGVQEAPDDRGGSPRAGSAWAGIRGQVRAARALLDRPLAPYYLIAGITTLLVCLGLVMVLSTTSVVDLAKHESAYHDFEVQLAGIVVGIPIMWVAARSSPRLFRALAYPLLAVAIIGLALTLIPGVAVEEGGAWRWIALGPLTFQPSELAKLALAVWGADLLARKEKLGMLADWRHMLMPLLPGTGLLVLLVMGERDLGTACILLGIFLALLWVVGAPGRVFVVLLIFMALVLALLIMTESYRAQRLASFLGSSTTNSASAASAAYQGTQGKYALGSGGFFGLGLGASREKWGYLPESTTDFIFAIIGEEFGLLGTLCVTALYGGLAYAGLHVARRVPDTFSRLLCASITFLIVMQAAINIGVVIGVFPVTGVPLPLVSQGLSSALVTMVGLGMLMSFARRVPGASQALAARGPFPSRRALSWLRHETRRGT
jgi:cell division protein FtsW